PTTTITAAMVSEASRMVAIKVGTSAYMKEKGVSVQGLKDVLHNSSRRAIARTQAVCVAPFHSQ
ncbi:MAG: hypothetical protein KGQ30_02985, partial [Burkholderiales bacterium]|nr:hypothetical protein [Burkholderiales bacterium]